jgi:hypothetical protein
MCGGIIAHPASRPLPSISLQGWPVKDITQWLKEWRQRKVSVNKGTKS